MTGHRPDIMLLVLMAVLASLSPAQAHRLKVFATVVGANIEGRVYFVGGGPAGNVSATLRDGQDNVVADGMTNSQGRFLLVSPIKADLVVVVDAKDGHMARFAIAAARLPDTLPTAAMAAAAPVGEPVAPKASASPAPSVAGDDIDAAIARQIEPLAEQIDALESALRLRDVLGGFGYIIGIFGLIAFLKARRTETGGKS